MENSKDDTRQKLELAEIVRRTCVEAAIEGYERAAVGSRTSLSVLNSGQAAIIA